MVTTEEKRIAIAQMMGESKEILFDTDANWQFAAIEYIESIKLNDMLLYYVQIGRLNCSIKSEEYAVHKERKTNKEAHLFYYHGNSLGDTKRKAIFEGLYHFTQHAYLTSN